MGILAGGVSGHVVLRLLCGIFIPIEVRHHELCVQPVLWLKLIYERL